VADERLFYGVNGSTLKRFEPKESENGLFWWGTDLMYYDYQADRSHSFTSSLSLSPDEQSVVLFVEHYQTVYLFDGHTTLQLEGYSIELFELNNLPESLRRDDAIPTLIIPNAQTATFSPDSQMIVTDVGLYEVEVGLVNRNIDGAISAFNADSTLLATYQDGYVTLWDVRYDGAATSPIAQYQVNNVRELGFSRDGSRLYVVRDGDVQLWGIQS
jgi:WD40 repeat protein